MNKGFYNNMKNHTKDLRKLFNWTQITINRKNMEIEIPLMRLEERYGDIWDIIPHIYICYVLRNAFLIENCNVFDSHQGASKTRVYHVIEEAKPLNTSLQIDMGL